jgi:hypothetical protein
VLAASATSSGSDHEANCLPGPAQMGAPVSTAVLFPRTLHAPGDIGSASNPNHGATQEPSGRHQLRERLNQTHSDDRHTGGLPLITPPPSWLQ